MFMAEGTAGDSVSVAGDHDFRTETLLRFYAPALPGGKLLRYVRKNSWPPGGPDWFLYHDEQRRPPPAPTPIAVNGIVYDFTALFPYSGISGWHWYLYRKASPQPDLSRTKLVPVERNPSVFGVEPP
jgi:hypothetical protein